MPLQTIHPAEAIGQVIRRRRGRLALWGHRGEDYTLGSISDLARKLVAKYGLDPMNRAFPRFRAGGHISHRERES